MSTLWLWLASAQALTVELTPVELCKAVDQVVVAEVTDIEPRFTADGRIERLVHVAVERSVKGPQVDALDLVLPGGSLAGLTLFVSDTPNLLTNARYLLFLHPQDGRLQVQGGDQGAVRLTRDGARRGVSLEQALASVEGCVAD